MQILHTSSSFPAAVLIGEAHLWFGSLQHILHLKCLLLNPDPGDRKWCLGFFLFPSPLQILHFSLCCFLSFLPFFSLKASPFISSLCNFPPQWQNGVEEKEVRGLVSSSGPVIVATKEQSNNFFVIDLLPKSPFDVVPEGKLERDLFSWKSRRSWMESLWDGATEEPFFYHYYYCLCWNESGVFSENMSLCCFWGG